MGKLLKAIGIFVIGVLSKVLIDTNFFKVEEVEFTTEKLPEYGEFRMLQMSDFHNKNSPRIHKKIIEKVKEVTPDIIVLTGDLIDRRTRDFNSIFFFLEALIATNIPIYFVSGNHEWSNPRRVEFLEGLEERGITILSNESIQIQHHDSMINLVGVEDAATHHEDLYQAFSSLKEDCYTILLSHTPYIINNYMNLPADLIVSGHTHGGQIRFPFIGAMISPGSGLFPQLDKGVFDWGNEQKLYVDSGLGTSMIPVRFLNQSQISLLTITGHSGTIPK